MEIWCLIYVIWIGVTFCRNVPWHKRRPACTVYGKNRQNLKW